MTLLLGWLTEKYMLMAFFIRKTLVFNVLARIHTEIVSESGYWFTRIHKKRSVSDLTIESI